MMISRRSFLKGSAKAGAAVLMLAFPMAAQADSGKDEINGMGGVQIVQSTSEDGYLRVTLDTVSRSVYREEEPSCVVLLGFTITNLTSQPVWLYHVHSNAFGEYSDGSGVVGGSFAGQPFQAQMARSDEMAEAQQTTGDDPYVSYGINPGQTIEVSANGSMSSGAGTLTLTFNPPEQDGANAGAHNSTYTFEVTFSETCTSGTMQMAYL